jgi:hypothetical protein
MTTDAPLSAILANLEAQIAQRRELEAFHAQQETHHGQQRQLHAAELEVLTKNLETFRAAAAAALDLADRPGTSTLASATPAPDPDPGRKPRLSRMVALIVESWPAGQPFGVSNVTAEVNRRYRERLRKGADPRMISVHLRRLLAADRLTAVQPGRPHHEALYARKE